MLATHRGRRWLVLGDMAELGAGADEFHEDAARMAREFGVERLYATGKLAAKTAAIFGEGAEHFETQEDLIAALTGIQKLQQLRQWTLNSFSSSTHTRCVENPAASASPANSSRLYL